MADPHLHVMRVCFCHGCATSVTACVVNDKPTHEEICNQYSLHVHSMCALGGQHLSVLQKGIDLQ